MTATIRQVSAVVLILADLYPTRLAPEARAALPRLPALERWLARGRRVDQDIDWRAWLLSAYGDAGRSPSLGGVAAAAWLPETRSDQHYWLATPIHAVAGLNTVHLHPAGLLHFEDAQQQLLASDFARVFAASGWELHATGHRELILSGPAIASESSQDPARWLGARLGEASLAGSVAAPQRRLSAELEMWLYGHAINRARLSRGLPAATGLWLWGGGPALRLAPPRLPTLIGDDLVAAALWRVGGGTAQALPDTFSGAPRDGDTVIILRVDNAEALQAINERWLAPALAAVSSGALRDAQLLVAGQRVQLKRVHNWRAWRRARAWWEML
ncbi:MAG TPA: hypothetical protein VF848_07410 [Steroidobacteraceae bacterium]